MYSAANRISPEQLEAIAAFLYSELLAAGYTQVCEFHYLHNAPDGRTYADPAEMSLALVRAAQRTGIGLTLLPTLYMRSGFAAKGLRDDQKRFASTPESVLRIAGEVRRQAGEEWSHHHRRRAALAARRGRGRDAGSRLGRREGRCPSTSTSPSSSSRWTTASRGMGAGRSNGCWTSCR